MLKKLRLRSKKIKIIFYLIFVLAINPLIVYQSQSMSLPLCKALYQIINIGMALSFKIAEFNHNDVARGYGILEPLMMRLNAIYNFKLPECYTLPEEFSNLVSPHAIAMYQPFMNVIDGQGVQIKAKTNNIIHTLGSQMAAQEFAIAESQMVKDQRVLEMVKNVTNKNLFMPHDLQMEQIKLLPHISLRMIDYNYHQEIINRFKNETLWTIYPIYQGVLFKNTAETVGISAQVNITSGSIAQVQSLQYQLREFASIYSMMPQQAYMYRMLIEHQTRHALDVMTLLTSEKLYERFLGLSELRNIGIGDIFNEGTHKVKQNLLKGYIHCNGDINWVSLCKKNNYVQPLINKFIDDIAPYIKNVDYEKYRGLLHSVARDKNKVHNFGTRHALWWREFAQSTHLDKAMQEHFMFKPRFECLKACLLNNFDEAQRIIKQYPQDQIMIKVYEELQSEYQQKVAIIQEKNEQYRAAMFDEFGFVKICLDNPMIAKLSIEEKQVIAQSSEQLCQYNMALLAQRHMKNNIMKLWNIPLDCPSEVHEAIYTLINEPRCLADNHLLIDKVSDLCKKRSELTSNFFSSQGVLKIFAQYRRSKSLPHVSSILHEKNNDLRKLLNHMLLLEDASPTKKMGDIAKEALDYYEFKVIEDPDRARQKLHIALSEIMVLLDVKENTTTAKVEAKQIMKSSYEKWMRPVAVGSLLLFGLHQTLALNTGQLSQTPVQKCEITDQISKDISICPKIGADEANLKHCGIGVNKEYDPKIKPIICGSQTIQQEDAIFDKSCSNNVPSFEPKTTCNYHIQMASSLTEPKIINNSPNSDIRESDPGFKQNPQIIIPDQDVKDSSLSVPDKSPKHVLSQVEKDAFARQKQIQKHGRLKHNPALVKIIEHYLRQHDEKSKNKCHEHGAFTRNGAHIFVPDQLKGIITTAEDWEKFAKVYDGLLKAPEIIGKDLSIWFDYQHIYTPVIYKDCIKNEIKVGGFHHDYLGKVRQSGVIDYVSLEHCETGCYVAKWKYGNSNTKPSSFFPSSWTHIQVIESIIEAIKKPIEIETKKGRWNILGKTQSGIRVIIIGEISETENSFKIVSAYPDLELMNFKG